MSFSKQILSYWRNSLADATRVKVEVDDFTHIREIPVDYEKGRISLDAASLLINQEEEKRNKTKGIEDRDHEDWEKLDQVQVMLSSFFVHPVPEYVKITGETGNFYPFWIKTVLNRRGELSPDDDSFPYIPRVYLEPQLGEEENFTFAQVETVDMAFAQAYEDQSWSGYWKYVQKIFREITGVDPAEYEMENYRVSRVNTIVINSVLANASDGIVRLYDVLRKQESLPPLLENLCRPGFKEIDDVLPLKEYEPLSLSHLGQMGYEHPLSLSQRRSLYHFKVQKKSDVMAVNGPPGTGKTTLLQSIVANELVLAAIEGNNPRIIMACSTNNQAVTNIIESFFNVKSKQGLLYQRWIPDINGFALYLPASGKKVAETIPYYKGLKSDTGIRSKIENEAFVEQAKRHFLKSLNDCSTGEIASVEEAIAVLRNQIIKQKEALTGGVELWQAYKEVTSLIQQLKAHKNLLTGYDLNVRQLRELDQQIKTLEDRVNTYLDKEPWWMKLFAFLKFIKEKRAGRLKQIFRDCPVNCEEVNFYRLPSLHQFFDVKISLIRSIQQRYTKWSDWKARNNIKGNPPQSEEEIRSSEKKKLPFFYDELETTVKYDLFYLAVHYWEGRWILDTEDVLREKRVRKNGEADAIRRWQRFSMLFPCFISTFHMAPKFITYSKVIRETPVLFESVPLLQFVDLLIVDEAGQVSPEVGGATFALAKKALVVGDTKQIEPVCTVPEKVDFANLFRFSLIESKNDAQGIDLLHDMGFLVSSGSIIKLAQKCSRYQLHKKVERGMLLTEHRRCFDEIIDYCNQLAYHGLLEPKKGPAKNILFESAMKFIPVDGESIKVNSSRANRREAEHIALWIENHQDQIVEHYQLKENTDALKEKREAKKITLPKVLAVITPFTGQKWIIQSTLKSRGIDISGMTIGTVHALQGAEREIILFSSVYGQNNIGGRYFFDQGVNMLNVAVSRARENFIVFGNEKVFTQNGGTSHSAKLYQHIKLICSIGSFK